MKKRDGNVEIEDLLNSPDVSDKVYFVECDSKYPDNIKEKKIGFQFHPKHKVSPKTILMNIWMRWNQIVTHKIKNYFMIGLIIRNI